MAKVKYLVAFVLMLVIGANMLFASDTQIQMTVWNRYTYVKSGDEVTEDQFSLARGYLRLNHNFSSAIFGRFNVDFFSDEDGLDGAGLKIKYAYLDFKKLIPIPDAVFTAGLMKKYFGTIYDWSYITVEKDPSDLYKVCSSTDYGLGISGLIPGGLGEYALALYNGEGYKKTGSDVNKYPAFTGNVRVTPLPGITVGGSAIIANKVGTSEPYDKMTAYAGVGRFVFGPIDIWAEYLMKNYTEESKTSCETKSAGFMVMPILKLFPNFELVFRYDQWDPNTDQDNDKKNMWIAGLNYYCASNVILQLNYENISYESSKSEDTKKIYAQLNWTFKTPKF
ncbi:MAG: hypothetical protein JW794_10170 [Candidatus Cloacimonetes bacterium]|nr:hypothetical protein [Candidatus Cloacimonadota bacterium]